jgi:DNA transformation protein
VPVSESYREYVLDQLKLLGSVTARSMFGGAGLYHDGLIFGILADDILYLRVDDSNRPDYEREGMRPFRPRGSSMPYYQVPVEVLEERETLKVWAQKALAISRRKSSPKRKKKHSR